MFLLLCISKINFWSFWRNWLISSYFCSFTETLDMVRNRHVEVVETMAQVRKTRQKSKYHKICLWSTKFICGHPLNLAHLDCYYSFKPVEYYLVLLCWECSTCQCFLISYVSSSGNKVWFDRMFTRP